MYGTTAKIAKEEEVKMQDVEIADQADEFKTGTNPFPMAKFLSVTVVVLGCLSILSSPRASKHGISAQLYALMPGFSPSAGKIEVAPPVLSMEPVSDSPGTNRKPAQYAQYSTNLFEHPKVQQAFLSQKQAAQEHVYTTCFGPENNIDTFVNEAMLQNDLLFNDGYTVFDLDCRDADAQPLIAFIVVLDKQGQIVNVHNPPVRAESVNMYSSDTVLFSCISKGGAWLWNWKTDETTRLPWTLDAHTLNYVAATGNFYGLDRGSKFDPSTAAAYNSEGERVWEYENPGSHINFLSIDGDYAYLSLRSYSCLVKVDMRTNEIVTTIGGDDSDFTVYDAEGNADSSGSWNHQHKFQHLDDSYVSLFDNHVNNEKAFIEGKNSRMMVLQIDEANKVAREVFAFDTGDKSRIYGGADILPSGNVLGNSYPMVIEPSVPDREYHVNIWEVAPSGEIVSRVGIKGMNPSDPTDTVSPFFHSVGPTEEPPIGWMIYNVERFYPAPTLTKPCAFEYEGGKYMQILPFNSVRTQGNAPGVLYLVDSEDNSLVTKQAFDFHGSWLPKAVAVPVPEEVSNKALTLVVSNQWGDNRAVELGLYGSLTQCTDLHQVRAFQI